MKKGVPILSANGLKAGRSGKTVLDVDRLEIGEGEVLAVIGPNGAGKSTLLMCLAGLLKPETGTIVFKGEPVLFGPPGLSYRRKTASVFQEPLLLRGLVEENVGTGLSMRGFPKKDIAQAVAENLERFGISHLAGRKTSSLSGGEAQRVSLARGFAVSPELVFLDEPFSALDPPTREGILEDLRANLAKTGAAAVFVTHDRSEALFLADRLAVMSKGRIVQEGRPLDVMNRPDDEFVASFVGMETLIAGTVTAADRELITVDAGGRTIEAVGEARPGSRVILGIRPENVVIASGGDGPKTSARNHFACEIVKISPQGPLLKIALNCGFSLTAFVTGRSAEEMNLRAGARVTASVKATAVHVITRAHDWRHGKEFGHGG